MTAISIHTRYFFDSVAVMNELTAAERSSLSKAGAFVMRRSRQSIRNRREKLKALSPSEQRYWKRRRAIAKQQGKPVPKLPTVTSQPGEAPTNITGTLRRGILFSYEAGTRSVFVGPTRFSDRSGTAPAALEFGGTARIGRRSVKVKPRPFMRPALQAEASKFPGLFANSIR